MIAVSVLFYIVDASCITPTELTQYYYLQFFGKHFINDFKLIVKCALSYTAVVSGDIFFFINPFFICD